MAALKQTNEEYSVALQEVAVGEALFASTLATLILTNQVASGRMSHDEVSVLLDGATLVLERHRGATPDNPGPVDYARNRLTALMNLLEQLGRSRRPSTNATK